MGKGSRPGFGFFGAKVARDLDRYLRLRARHPRASLPDLWLAQKGALTGDGIHHLIQRRARMAGIERTIHPHLTRHSWAHAMKSAGASDEDVMTLGRWRDRKGDGAVRRQRCYWAGAGNASPHVARRPAVRAARVTPDPALTAQ